MKKKLILTTVLAALAISMHGCDLIIPLDESSAVADISFADISEVESAAIPAESAASLPTDISVPENSDTDTSFEESSEDESSELPHESSDESSTEEPSEASQPEENSEPPSAQTIGSLFSSYYRILESGKYVLKTVESKIVGGEAMPYTTTVYHDGNAVHMVIEESYGATSELIIMDGFTYWLDRMSKQAIKTPGTEGLDAERVLYTDNIRYLRKETYKSFDTEYACEIYSDSRGHEFSFGFSSFGELRIYRYYDPAKKDVITIDIDISANTTAIFVPDDYAVIG